MPGSAESYRSPGRCLAVLWALLLAALLLVGCAQAAPPALILRDEREQLDRQRIAEAAAPLLARGATVAVIIVERGDDRGEDLSRRLAAEGLLVRDDSVPPLLAVYVSYEPRYSELRAGSDWGDRLPDPTLRTIRERQLNAALRAADPDEGVAATLAALEAEIAVGQWLERTIGLSVLALVGALSAILLLARPAERLWWRFRAAWPDSPLGRLWAATPLGRRQAARRYRRELAAARLLLDQAAEHARVADGGLEARWAALETLRADLVRRAGLAHRPSDDPDLLAAIRAARQDYAQLALDAGKLVSSVGLDRMEVESAVRRAAELLARVTASFAPRDGSSVADPAAYRTFAELRAALAALGERWVALAQAPATAELRAQLGDLRDEYSRLEQGLLALWKSAFPRAYAGYMKHKQREAAKQRQRASSSPSSDAASAGYIASSAASSSSSDYQSDYGSSSSSSSSSDGGSW